MRIAINAIFLQKEELEGYGHYTNEIVRRMVRQHPRDEFILVFDRPYDEKYIYGENVTAIIVPPVARHPFAFYAWYNFKAPAALRKYKVDAWLQPYGFCSLTTRIPQVMVVHDLAFHHFPKFVPWYHRLYYRLFTKKFLNKAESVVAVSEFTKKDITDTYKIAGERVRVIYGAARDVFKPVSWFEREDLKESFAGGAEYFICTGGIHPRKNLMNLLKAFSLFKKWQHSNMKLLVAGRLAWDYDDILEKLKTYKYRDDVILLGYQPDETLARITAGAYALLYPSFFEGFGLPIIEAMQSEVPVITSDTGSMPETGGDAALYANPHQPDAIAKHIQHLYRDEILRTTLVEAGKKRAQQFSWNKAAEEMWNALVAVSV